MFEGVWVNVERILKAFKKDLIKKTEAVELVVLSVVLLEVYLKKEVGLLRREVLMLLESVGLKSYKWGQGVAI